MNYPEPSIRVNVDVTNPGQFFACCGLLELADRLWPGAEGWFARGCGQFAVYIEDNLSATLTELMQTLRECDISGLTEDEEQEREYLEKEKRRLKDEQQTLSEEQEQRRKDLGAKARAGPIILGQPFSCTLNWWQSEHEQSVTPKTWAGRQELHRITKAAQNAIPDSGPYDKVLDYGAVMRLTADYHKKKSDQDIAVEPFYFDARRFAHALNAGFSLNIQDAETTAHPTVEFLTLVGLQRFRPRPESKRSFVYGLWTHRLSPSVAAAVTCGAVTSPNAYRFKLLSRDDQDRYKAFDFATPIGDPS